MGICYRRGTSRFVDTEMAFSQPPTHPMTQDIRDQPYLNEKDFLALNFVKRPGRYVFRRYYRQGLRSHIMEVVHLKDMKNEAKGIILHGLRSYPKAVPLKMFRIFRTKFETLEQARKELARFKTVVTYLAPEHMAMSEEFLVTYNMQKKRVILLCGLQEFVRGVLLDPWSHLDEGHLITLRDNMGWQANNGAIPEKDQWICRVRKKAESLVQRIKKMVREAKHIPDLAGVGNLLLTRSGAIKLVDINNISRVSFDKAISVDDRGYPVCDKSIQALALLERKLLTRPLDKTDPVYEGFLDPVRIKEVQAKEEAFNFAIAPSSSYLGTS